MCFQNRREGLTYNVIDAWKKGYTGEGIVVAVVDEGFSPKHPELEQNYVSFLFLLQSLLCSCVCVCLFSFFFCHPNIVEN